MKYIRLASRIILGVVFLFSGFVKAVDPLGSAYKFSDYFSAFGLDFMKFLALPLAVILCAFEMVLGLTLILGYRRKTAYRVLMWFMLFFTVLTLVLAVFNPVSDCGCFGDALVLTNWQTFLKNVVLMVFVVLLFSGRKEEQEHSRPVRDWSLIALMYVAAVLFSLWNFRHLPLLDFRPFDVGTQIAREMVIPEGAPVDEYETTLTYRNRETGKSEKFSISDYPRDTARWKFVDSESRLLRKGYEPPIHDFAFTDPYGNDLADRILADPGYNLLMVSHDLSRADGRAMERAREWARLDLLAEDYSFFAITSSTGEEVAERVASLGLDYEFLAADEIMLKTMVRSNPGFILISNGVIIAKWGSRDFPELGKIHSEAPGLLEHAAAPLDEEAQLLKEAGIYESFSFDVLDFDTLIPDLVLEPQAARRERGAVATFILGVMLVVLLSNLASPVKL
jgi:uncharacterized membrane protein YphA (DoxX/SURF4 family)